MPQGDKIVSVFTLGSSGAIFAGVGKNNVFIPSDFTVKKIRRSGDAIKCLLREDSIKKVPEVFQKKEARRDDESFQRRKIL